MKFCIIILTDGRNEYLSKTLESLDENVIFPSDADIFKIMVDDWPDGRDEKSIRKIAKKHKVNKLILNNENIGIDNSVQLAWSLIPDDIDYVWHQENDFVYLEKVDVSKLITILFNPMIVQCALVRQPWYDDEKQSGSLMNTRPQRFRQANISGIDVVVHRDHFTHNPSLYKRKWIEQLKNYNEYFFKDHLLRKNPGLYFSYYGKKEDHHRILHIGEVKR
jgi:GT2 family glycosyltransferase